METFEQYEIPATLAIERGFADTALGEVVSELVSLSRDDPALESVTSLLSNPLVTNLDDDVRADRSELARVANRLTSRRLATAYEHLNDDVETAIISLVADAAALRDCSLAILPERVDSLPDRLGVTDAVDSLPKTPRGRTERAAKQRLDRTLETVALTDGIADLTRVDPVDRLERALTDVTLDAESGREDDHVLVCGLDETADAGTFDESRRQRLHQGVACAAARASPDFTPYDGELSPETVAMLHGTGSRTPYSPSQ